MEKVSGNPAILVAPGLSLNTLFDRYRNLPGSDGRIMWDLQVGREQQPEHVLSRFQRDFGFGAVATQVYLPVVLWGRQCRQECVSH
jgi:hypothetical protein